LATTLLRAIFGMAKDQTLMPEESGARIDPDDVPHYRKAITSKAQPRISSSSTVSGE